MGREGHLDVTPRGGQPSVITVDAAGRWLLPDYRGNRRLDTIGNLLSNPEIALMVLNQGNSKVLSVSGTAEPSFSPEDLRAFPEDEK
ncbi:pyridoxamine 5'-phosphate oxidase family protein [Pseudosulfitobacter pseudonitzschiae]|uniref:pyridoxamine 5'-phosphate oxidase family protein n=1 Tax=Pseudosulfitobacter pseudonitzschiae TaxID=1402135 RepID=UPI003B808A15